jgi:hypothetical protein
MTAKVQAQRPFQAHIENGIVFTRPLFSYNAIPGRVILLLTHLHTYTSGPSLHHPGHIIHSFMVVRATATNIQKPSNPIDSRSVYIFPG